MKIKRLIMTRYFLLTLITFFSLFQQNVRSEEKDNILFIEDWNPYYIGWVKDKSGDWVHVLTFQKARVKTYFKKGPTTPREYRFNLENPPYKQTIDFPAYNLCFSSTNLSTEILDEGILCFGFTYDNEFERGSEKYLGICISLMQGCNKTNDRYEYSLMPHYFKF